jgi:3-methyladenine DNA glycosylase/8-oxoguanine DNA glycosylase
MPTRTIEPPRPLDVRATLGALGIGLFDRTGNSWIALRTPSGEAAVSVASKRGILEADAWGAGADELLDRLPRLLGFDDESAAVDPPAGPVRALHRRARGLRLGSTGAVWDALAATVLGQKVTTKEANRSYRRLVDRYGTPAPGPRADLRLPPTPERIAAVAYEDLHPLGIERRRATTLVECARRARRLEAALEMEPEEARRRLRAVRGVGAWTTEGVMATAYGDRDAALVGDFHMPNLVAWALAGEARADDDRMLELLEPYRPYRRRAQVLLKRSGMHAPRFGPKAALRSIERI